MSVRWSESDMLKFIDLYNKHDCLWNHRLDTYKHKDARDNALTAIVEEMDISALTIFDVKNKIKTIRTMYKKEFKLVQKSKKNGSEKIYVPRLFWYKKADAFLDAVTVKRDTTSNLNLVQKEYEAEREKWTHGTTEDLELAASASITSRNAHTQTEIQTPKHSKPVVHAPSRKRKIVQDITRAIDKLDKVVQSNNEDEFDTFGKHVAVQLKQMPLYDAIICQQQIQTILVENRLELIRKESQPTTASPVVSPASNMEGEFRSSSSISHDYSNSEHSEDDVKPTSPFLSLALNNF